MDNATRCEACPMTYWPDSVNQTECLSISPTIPTYTDAVVLMFVAFAMVGVLSSFVVFSVYVRHNDARIIKATSRELSYMMLVGLTIQVSVHRVHIDRYQLNKRRWWL